MGEGDGGSHSTHNIHDPGSNYGLFFSTSFVLFVFYAIKDCSVVKLQISSRILKDFK